MTFIVVDASVAVKWLLPQQPEEADVDKALLLLQAISRQDVRMRQPPHFLAELMGVIVRLAPDYAERLFSAIQHLEMSVADNEAVYQLPESLGIKPDNLVARLSGNLIL